MAIIAEFDLAIREAIPETATEPDQISFCGQLFTVAEQVGPLPMMRLAHALDDPTVTNMQTLGLVYALLEHCIAPQDWARFAALATARMVQVKDLTRIGYKIYGHVSARPTRRSSGSSDGPPTTTDNSKPGSSSPDTGQESGGHPPGRPDLAGLVSVDSLLDG